MSKKTIITVSAIAMVIVLAIIITIVSIVLVNHVPVPEKYVKNWKKDMPFDNTCYQTLEIKGEEPSILQLTDIHYDDHNNRKEWTLNLIKKTIEQTQPDIIAVTGDWVSNNVAKQRAEATRIVFDVIDSYGIPWFATFGNHDDEGELTKYDYADIFATYKNSMFDVGFTNLKGGAGNYVIVLTKNGKPQQALVAVDSHGALRKGSTDYDYIGKNQIDWYKWAMAGVQNLYKQSGGAGIIPSITFQHIPVNEYKENMNDTSKYVLGENSEDCFPGKKNTGWFDALKEVGSCLGVFFGHDHANNKIIKHEGIYLGYGLESGWCKGYAEDCKKGALLITMTNDRQLKLEQIEYPKD